MVGNGTKREDEGYRSEEKEVDDDGDAASKNVACQSIKSTDFQKFLCM
jgi:hypothetical protein